LNPEDGVIQSKVLKGFQFRIEHLYTRPDLENLIEDPVYRHYVKLDTKRANGEKTRADQNENILKLRKKRVKEKEKILELYRNKLLELDVVLEFWI